MLRIEIEQRDGICLLRFDGRMVAGLDLDYLREKADEAKRQAAHGLVADLSAVPAIGSTGIGMLVSLYASAKKAGSRLVVAAPQDRVREVLEFTRVATLIPLLPDVPSAIAACKAGRSAAG